MQPTPLARREPDDRAGERGQILVVFTLSIVVVLAMIGLALDAGSTFNARREQQNAADMAALAAANHYLINNDEPAAIALAEAIATENGFTNGVDSATVGVGVDTSNGVIVTVDIGDQHRNAFLGVVGMSTWGVAATARAQAGFPDTAYGVSPFVFSIGAFDDSGTPLYQTPTLFGDTNDDAPTGPTDFAWTNYGTGNVDSSEVADLIDGDLVIDKEVQYGEYIGQFNNGNHSTLFDNVDTYLSGLDLPVAVVDDNGNFMGWAMFHVISAEGGSTKKIEGYFLTKFVTGRLSVTACASLACPRYLGAYVLRLSA
jgi:Flp pilus assembly protein TadG